MTREEMADNFGANAEKERTRLGYSQAKMAEILGLSLSAYKRILTGETTRIDIYTIHRMYMVTHQFGCDLCGSSSPCLDVFYKLRKLSQPQLRTISSMIDFELAFTEELKNNELAPDYVTIYTPTGNMQDGMIYDSSHCQKLNIAPYQKRYRGIIDCGICVTTNHLHPVYHTGDILLISRQPIRDGDTGIFINKTTGLVYIRRYHQTNPYELEPLNGYGKTLYIDHADETEMSHWIKFGYVVTKMRT